MMCVRVKGSARRCEVCELNMSPDHSPGDPLGPHGVRPMARSRSAARAITAAPTVKKVEVATLVTLVHLKPAITGLPRRVTGEKLTSVGEHDLAEDGGGLYHLPDLDVLLAGVGLGDVAGA